MKEISLLKVELDFLTIFEPLFFCRNRFWDKTFPWISNVNCVYKEGRLPNYTPSPAADILCDAAFHISSLWLAVDHRNMNRTNGVSRLIYTDINRDGMKQSPNFEETSKVADISKCPVIISGGVSSISDIKKAKSLKNIEGIIVGKAIYDGDIKLEELVKEDA